MKKLETQQPLKLRETPKTLQFALFDGIVEFDECPLLSEGEEPMRSEEARARTRQSSFLEKKRLRKTSAGSRFKRRPQEFVHKEKSEQT